MSEEHMSAWTRASRVIRARREELYAAFLDPSALVNWLPPEEMTGEIHQIDARVGRIPDVAVPPAESVRLSW